jgi:hypothetical protein
MKLIKKIRSRLIKVGLIKANESDKVYELLKNMGSNEEVIDKLILGYFITCEVLKKVSSWTDRHCLDCYTNKDRIENTLGLVRNKIGLPDYNELQNAFQFNAFKANSYCKDLEAEIEAVRKKWKRMEYG